MGAWPTKTTELPNAWLSPDGSARILGGFWTERIPRNLSPQVQCTRIRSSAMILSDMADPHPGLPRQHNVIRQYLEAVMQSVSQDGPYIERRFISDEKWQRYTGDHSFRFSGSPREYEPDLPKLLANKRLVVVGEPGAGKSTVARIVVRRLAAK